jgi:ubiquinone/menaquinone biosynthesis C-methylase UbiE
MSKSTDAEIPGVMLDKDDNSRGDALSRYTGEGDPEVWNNVWRSSDSSKSELYTEGTPEHLGHLVHQGYFNDLWYFMGESARSARYLEVGAGRGTLAMYLSKRKCDVTMLDMSAEGFRIAEINFKRRGIPSPRMIIADAQSTGLRDSSYDCVYSIGLVEHFIDPLPLLRESLRLLKPGGLMFKVIVPKQSLTRAWLLWLLLNPMDYSVVAVKHVVKRMIGYPNPADKSRRTTRTDYSRSQYVKWMIELGAVDVLCIPYLPYRRVYRSNALEKNITFPLCRRHYFRKKHRQSYPILRTHWSAAFCDLLICRKGKRVA